MKLDCGFDNSAAHNMAVLAMAQFAHMLHAIEPRLRLVQQDAEVREALHAGRPALWLPLPLLREQPDELSNWDVSSDSLALWLARRLHAERLVVVKDCAIDPAESLAELGARGVLDRRFADWARDAAFPIEVLCGAEIDRVRERLVGGGSLGGQAWGKPQADAAPGAVPSPGRRRTPRRRSADAAELAEPTESDRPDAPRH